MNDMWLRHLLDRSECMATCYRMLIKILRRNDSKTRRVRKKKENIKKFLVGRLMWVRDGWAGDGGQFVNVPTVTVFFIVMVFFFIWPFARKRERLTPKFLSAIVVCFWLKHSKNQRLMAKSCLFFTQTWRKIESELSFVSIGMRLIAGSNSLELFRPPGCQLFSGRQRRPSWEDDPSSTKSNLPSNQIIQFNASSSSSSGRQSGIAEFTAIFSYNKGGGNDTCTFP